MPKSAAHDRIKIAESLHLGVAREIDEIGSDLAEIIGRRALTPALRSQLRALLAKNTALSVRMREEILQLRGMEQSTIAQVKKVREIAQSQFLSQTTVKTHLAAIYRKLGVTNKTAALDVARSAGLLALK